MDVEELKVEAFIYILSLHTLAVLSRINAPNNQYDSLNLAGKGVSF